MTTYYPALCAELDRLREKATLGPWSTGDTLVRNLPSGSWPETPVHVGKDKTRGNVICIVHSGGNGATRSTQDLIEANADYISRIHDLHSQLDAAIALIKAKDEALRIAQQWMGKPGVCGGNEERESKRQIVADALALTQPSDAQGEGE